MCDKFDKDAWATPQWLFDWQESIYDFDVDLCANDDNAKCKKYITKEKDSLSVDWSKLGWVGWCNPPYSNISPWVEKAARSARKGFTTVMLIPTPNGEKYYSSVFSYATAITFITGRIAFYNPLKKTHITGNTRGSCIVEFGPRSILATQPRIINIKRDNVKPCYE